MNKIRNKIRIISIALVFSVALNLLFIGAVVGRFLHGPPQRPGPHLDWVLRNMDEESRGNIRPILQEYAKTMRPLRHEMRQAQRQFRRLLAAESFDEAALEESLSQLQESSAAYQTGMHHQMLMLLKDLEPQQRRRVARFLMRPRPEGREHGPGKKRP